MPAAAPPGHELPGRGGGGEVAAPRGVARRRGRGPRLQGGGLRAGAAPSLHLCRAGKLEAAPLDARRRGGAGARRVAEEGVEEELRLALASTA